MEMQWCEDKLNRKTAHLWLPSVGQKLHVLRCSTATAAKTSLENKHFTVIPSFVYSVMLAKARYKFTARTKASNDSLSQDLILLFTANSIRVEPHSEGLSFPSPGVGGRETSLMALIEALQTFCSE